MQQFCKSCGYEYLMWNTSDFARLGDNVAVNCSGCGHIIVDNTGERIKFLPIDNSCATNTWLNWYEENIEEPVRDIVRLLRNNGINTINSCGHNMTIECSTYNPGDDIDKINNLLKDAGYPFFKIEYSLEVISSMNHGGNITVMFPDDTGEYNFEIRY